MPLMGPHCKCYIRLPPTPSLLAATRWLPWTKLFGGCSHPSWVLKLRPSKEVPACPSSLMGAWVLFCSASAALAGAGIPGRQGQAAVYSLATPEATQVTGCSPFT